jgi:ABC-type phosphate transport system substrate-binding protein
LYEGREVKTTIWSKALVILAVIACSISFARAGLTETAMIVHPSNTNELSEKDISRIFLGKQLTFPDGSEAVPIDRAPGSEQRSSFNRVVLRKTDQQVKAYWAKQVFTGKRLPPKRLTDAEEILTAVSENPNSISYIDSSLVDDSVRVVTTF